MKSKNHRILFVDDDTDLLSVGEKIIERLGYHVIPHSDSAEALALFKDLPNQFDLVITDFKMPKLNGAELSREILKINPDLPVIMCSGYSSTFSEEDAEKIGIKWFVRKPLLKKDFAAIIEEALNGNNK